MRALQHHAADHGCVVLMEVKTGRIKAIANLGLIKDSTYGEILNYAVGEASEPGSTFKLATAAALIEDGLVDNSSLVFVGDGKFAVRNRVIADHDKPESAEITFQRAFEVSSNVAMAALADKHYNAFKEKLYKHFENFGFTKAIDVELPGAATPLLRDVKQWSGVSAAYLAHGYELAITPLHTLMFYNAIANNGVMVAPHIVDRVREYNTTLDSTETRVINSEVCSPKTIQSLRKLLEGVVENGTARNLKTDYLRVAGKTGTAVVSQGKGGYNNSGRKIYRASFCGYFPVDDPQYSMIVMINSPSANGYYGNVVAGTIFKEVADKVYSMNIQMHRAVNRDSATVKKLPVVAKGSADDLKKVYAYLGKNVSDVSGWIQVTNEADNINTSEIEMYNQLVPDVTGFSMKDALYLLEGMGLKTVVNGYGHVVQQSVAGVPAVKGMVVQLDFK